MEGIPPIPPTVLCRVGLVRVGLIKNGGMGWALKRVQGLGLRRKRTTGLGFIRNF